MFATIELQKQAAADRYYHQLHPKPWAKSPEEAAWALMQRIMGLGQWDGYQVIALVRCVAVPVEHGPWRRPLLDAQRGELNHARSG